MPQPETSPNHRAMRPSSQSENAAATISPPSHATEPSTAIRYVIGAISTRRRRLRTLGTVQSRPSEGTEGRDIGSEASRGAKAERKSVTGSDA